MFTMSVSDLGPIKEGEIEFSRLTVLCGNNNTGKTFLATSIYSYFEFLSKHPIVKNTNSIMDVISETVIHELYSTGKATVAFDVQRIADDIVRNIEHGNDVFPGTLDSCFAAKWGCFAGAKVRVNFDSSLIMSLLSTRLHKLRRLHNMALTYDEGRLTLKLDDYGGMTNLPFKSAWGRLTEFLTCRLCQPPRTKKYYSTSARNGLAMMYQDINMQEPVFEDRLIGAYEMSQTINGKGLEDLPVDPYAAPIMGELGFLRDLHKITRDISSLISADSPDAHRYIEEIMGARIVFDGIELRVLSDVDPENKFNISLDLGSSSSKELAGLYIYLKHHAAAGDFLVLDEPESHLSTANQIKFAQLLSILVNQGVRILMSTHSEILLKELSNLMMFAQLDKEQEEVRDKLGAYKQLNGIGREYVKVYYCSGRKVEQCLVNEWGMKIPELDVHLDVVDRNSLVIGNALHDKIR